jgi:5'-nucleotidase
VTRLLVTNDDGVRAPGILALATAMVGTGHDVVVAAPQEDMSGTSASIGRFHADMSIDVEEVELDGLDGVPCYAVAGPPALVVLTARMGGFGEPPDVVVAGINPGPNTGGAVLHSGTVGAALTGANFGISGLAVSMGAGAPYHWSTPAALAAPALEWLLDQPQRTVLNLNVPNLPLSEVRGVRWGELATFGSVRAALVESQGGKLQLEFSERERDLPPDSDAELVHEGFATVTTIVGPQAVAPGDGLTDAVTRGLLQRSA